MIILAGLAPLLTMTNKKPEIKKLKIKKLIDVLNQLTIIPSLLDELPTISENNLFSFLFTLVYKAYPDVRIILSEFTDYTEKEIDELEIDEVVNLLDLVIEKGKILETYERIKKMTARFQKPKQEISGN